MSIRPTILRRVYLLRDAVALVCFLASPRRVLAFAWASGPRPFELRAVVRERDEDLDAAGFLPCAPDDDLDAAGFLPCAPDDDLDAAGFLACALEDLDAAGFLACALEDLDAAGFLACALEDDLARWLFERWVDARRGARFSLRGP